MRGGGGMIEYKKSLCDTCKYDCVAGCLFYCGGVTGWDEENEAVTSCEDYEEATA